MNPGHGRHFAGFGPHNIRQYELYRSEEKPAAITAFLRGKLFPPARTTRLHHFVRTHTCTNKHIPRKKIKEKGAEKVFQRQIESVDLSDKKVEHRVLLSQLRAHLLQQTVAYWEATPRSEDLLPR